MRWLLLLPLFSIANMIEAGIKQGNDITIVIDTIAAKKPVTQWLLSIPRSPSLLSMTLAAVCRTDLEPIAATIFKESEICATLASQQCEVWDPEAERLIANTYSSGISQLIHLQRALMIAALDLELAAALNPA